jgi:hypothetical protein
MTKDQARQDIAAAETPVSVSRATKRSVCGAPGCRLLIVPGMVIRRGRGGAWQHADCDATRHGMGRRARRAAWVQPRGSARRL